MEKELTLVVMAAGLGSRFGGLKQLTPVTPDGRGILDFSAYDAEKAGFGRVVFVIREEMKEEFFATVGARVGRILPVGYVYQNAGEWQKERKKPLGTAHAVLRCKDAVNGPFAVINADDFYGRDAFVRMAEHLRTAQAGEYAMVAYDFEKTVSENGTVNRGVCRIADGMLLGVSEVRGVSADGTYREGGETRKVPRDAQVSMNLWGLTPDVFPFLEEAFSDFLSHADLSRDEFSLPLVLTEMAERNRAKIRVLQSRDRWYGMTYFADLDGVKSAMAGLIARGEYPEKI